jgi:hypothetical protein
MKVHASTRKNTIPQNAEHGPAKVMLLRCCALCTQPEKVSLPLLETETGGHSVLFPVYDGHAAMPKWCVCEAVVLVEDRETGRGKGMRGLYAVQWMT